MVGSYVNLDKYEAQTAAAIFNRLFPLDENAPSAVEMGVLDYLDSVLSGSDNNKLAWYQLGLRAVNTCAVREYGCDFISCNPDQQDNLLGRLEKGELTDFFTPPQRAFFEMLCRHLMMYPRIRTVK